ncbi:hypothetical protein NEUTE1DRAFT_117440 [Neurospora tetrasperma FGSC 2508]|uniref:Uncharacterized protein n=1 Tax=Neurospora tetrasperma (strain FGSC 2508 / ATCC MYA-4615 / P0657) TaxID=510951 RepID=F8MQP5_NEUT8|nr:uncharacterized protein NEUTE1DRAFT_117440 [Neurospora tetrasperma FGSC 2508]EGO56675.1 hypothetical protein NEUTE1DRAFT_117440 [Neurospora tetrasperma FGSC 2508]EGZ70450.1 hypothetical protein NEUTE2DRAFT_145039 [Neurospora tetrasperma FGSC 2509]
MGNSFGYLEVPDKTASAVMGARYRQLGRVLVVLPVGHLKPVGRNTTEASGIRRQ